MSKEKQIIEFLQNTVDSLELQIAVAKEIGETSISLSIERAEHYLGLCAALTQLQKGANNERT